ncbi:MAG: DUF4352 domain-containing protein [Clostridium baratii]
MKKKPIIINVVIAIVFFIVGSSIGYNRGESNAYNKMSKTLTSTDTSQQSNSKSEENSTVKTIKLNQAENLGNVELKVLKTKETNKISNESGNVSASGNFIIIELSIKNKDKQPIQYDPNQFQLINGETTYTVDDVAFDALGKLNSQETIYNENKDFVGSYDSFNSGLTKKTYLVFDVPKDVSLDKAKLIVENNKNIQFSLK